jgi:hypothetical protein
MALETAEGGKSMSEKEIHVELEETSGPTKIYESHEAATEALEAMSAELIELSKRHNTTAQIFLIAFSYGLPDNDGRTGYRYRTLVSGVSDLLEQLPEPIKRSIEATVAANVRRELAADDQSLEPAARKYSVDESGPIIIDKGGKIH